MTVQKPIQKQEKVRRQYKGVTLVEKDPDVDLVQIMLDALYAFYSKDRDKVHISDIILCPREAAFRKIYQQPITVRELNYFLFGRAWHDSCQTLAGMLDPAAEDKQKYIQMMRWKYPNREFEVEKEFLRNDLLFGHIDLYDKTKNIPYELKTYRGFKPEENPKPFNIQQLKCYMALCNSKVGGLVYFYTQEFDNELDMMETYRVTMTDDERKEMLDWMDANANAFKLAVEKQDPSITPHIFYNTELNWKCEKTYEKKDKKTGEVISRTTYKNCKYFDECKAMRDKERAEKFNKGGQV